MSDNYNSSTANEGRSGLLKTVMLVDDSETDGATYQRYLRTEAKYQFNFVRAETGEEAFASYLKYQPDIILLDYLLPDMDGLEWLSQLQQGYDCLCPIIVVTGQGDESIAVQFIKLGAADYLVKGRITAEKLKLSVRREIELRELQQEKENLVSQFTLSNEELIQSKILCDLVYSEKENLQKIIDRAPIVVYAKDIDSKTKQSGKFWLVNQEFQRIFGLSKSEIIGKTDRDLFPPNIVDALAANDLVVLESQNHLTIEEEVLHADGKLHSYISLKFPLFDHSQQIVSIVGIAQNITREKQVEDELSRSNSRFYNTFEQAAVGIAHVATDGKWLEVNQKLCQIVGYTKEELLAKTFQDISHPDDLNEDLRYVEQMLVGEISNYSMEKRYIHQTGAYIWINLTVSLVRDDSGEPDYFISVVEDISDRITLELSLQKSHARLSNLHRIDRAILAAEKPQKIAQTVIQDIQHLFDCQRTSIVTFDREAETATVLATKGLASNILNDGLQISLKVWQEIIDRLHKVENKQNYVVFYLDRLPSLTSVATALESTDLNCFLAFPLKFQNNLLGILKLWVANSQQFNAEELMTIEEISSQLAIAIAQARLYEQTQKYALELESRVAQRTAQIEEINRELKAFTYSISHDLKAPLRAIEGFSSAIQEDYGDCLDDLGQEYLARSISSAQHMTQLIEDLLSYSRLSRTEIQLKRIDLSMVVDLALEQLQPEIDRTQAVITVERSLHNIIGNHTVLLQIISNLLSNALKFVPAGIRPQIRIGTEIITEDEFNSQANRVRLWIEDNGIGINPEHQERIFHVFERLHGNEAYPGTGIGLAIVKKGIERLGGKFGVESHLERGSRFWVEGRGVK